MAESKIIKDEQLNVALNELTRDALIKDGWTLVKTNTIKVKKKDSNIFDEVPVSFILHKVFSPREFKVSEIKWVAKDAIRGRHTEMGFGSVPKLNFHNYNIEVMKVAVQIRTASNEEFRALTDIEWDNLEGRLGDRLLHAMRILNEPSDEDLRNLL